MEPAEYAQAYTSAERLRFVALAVVCGALAVGIGKLWLFPWISHFSAGAPCSSVLGVNGAAVLWYSLLVGPPLLGAIVVAFGYGRIGLMTLREDRFPPARTKVFRPTRIIRGPAARRMGYLRLAAFTPFLALSVWGFAQAAHLAHRSAATKCAASAFDGQSDRPRFEVPADSDGGTP